MCVFLIKNCILILLPSIVNGERDNGLKTVLNFALVFMLVMWRFYNTSDIIFPIVEVIKIVFILYVFLLFHVIAIWSLIQLYLLYYMDITMFTVIYVNSVQIQPTINNYVFCIHFIFVYNEPLCYIHATLYVLF